MAPAGFFAAIMKTPRGGFMPLINDPISGPSRWRRLLERSGVDRNPVSLTRQRAGFGLFVIIVLGLSTYLISTRDAAIRKLTIAFLQQISSGEVHVGSAQFKMFGGITLQDVRISTPYDARLDPTAKSPEQREIFSARSLHLVHNPWLLLLGKFRVEEIVAIKPRITLVHNADSDFRNWQLLAIASADKNRRPQAVYRPDIRVRAAEGVVVSIQENGDRDTRKEELDADIRPNPLTETGYYIEIRRFSEPAERVTVLFDPATRLVTNTPFVDAQTVRLQLPRIAQQFFDRISLRGEVKLSRMIYDPAGTAERDTEIRLRKVQCKLPLSVLRSGETDRDAGGRDSPDSFVTMTDVEGKMQLRRGRFDLQVSGRVNGGVCHLQGSLENVDGPLDQMGIDVHMVGDSVPAPEGAMRRALLEDTAVPKDLQVILIDYDPHGPFDFDFNLRRPTGPAGRMVMTGILEPDGASAMSRKFPYAIDQIHGRVRFEGTNVYIEHLHGRHGPAELNFEGYVDQSRAWSSVHVDIEGRQVPLDGAMLQALPRRDQRAWMRFTPLGDVDLEVKLRRAGGDANEPSPPFLTHVSAKLENDSISLKEGAYWLRDVRGRLEMDEDRIEFFGLSGQHDEGTLQVDGYATIPENLEPEMDLCVMGQQIRLDQELAEVLPPEGRGAFAQFRPQGYLDASGSIRRVNSAATTEYDLQASIYDCVVEYESFPYVVSDVNGRVNIRTQGVSILHVEGVHGTAHIEIRGEVQRHSSGYEADLNLACTTMPIDGDLYAAFPAKFRRVWQMFEPQGTARLRSTLHYEVDDKGSRHRHRTQLLIENGGAVFSGFPMPLKHMSAELVLSDQRAELINLSATSGGGTIHLDGSVDTSLEQPSGMFNLSAEDFRFEEALYRALPESIAGSLRGMSAGGRFDLRLRPLQFEPEEQGRWNWTFSGTVQLKDVSADLGMELRNTSGVLEGQGSVNSRGRAGMNLIAKLDSARCAGWDLRNINTRLLLSPESTRLEIRDGVADAYGGEVGGFATIDMGGRASTYQASITAREVRLDRYLEEMPTGKSTATGGGPHAQGKLFGNMFLRGRTGPGGYREGAGEMYVRAAQVWKLPLIMAIFQVLNLTPDENVFHDGRLKFFLNNDTLTFSQIDLQGRAVSFVGGGKMDLVTRAIDVTLLAGSPLRLRIPILTELLEKASREFMEVRIRGTVEHPKIQPQPLRSLKKTLQTIFPLPPRSQDAQTVAPDAIHKGR
jgi:hypothetical protein